MKSDIMFKVWDKANKEWLVYKKKTVGWQCPLDKDYKPVVMHVYCSRDDVAFSELQYCIDHPKHFAVVRYSGKKDKKNRKMYEGDIILLDNGWMEQIVFEEGCFCVEPVGKDNPAMPVNYEATWWHEETMKVVGNIYQNPKLLK